MRCEIAGPAGRLEGRWTPGPEPRRAAVVAPPHPLYGGNLDNPVVGAVEHGLAEAGVAALAFNYRGIGASEGQAGDDPVAAAQDYAAALDALADRAPGPYLAAGYSFGARAALAVAASDPRIVGAVLVAPPVVMLDAAAVHGFGGPVLVVVGDRDGYAPLPELRARLDGRPNTEFQVVVGADHFFGPAGPGAVADLVAAWAAVH